MTREKAFGRLKVLVRARMILRADGATVGSVHERAVTDRHLDRVAARLRDQCRPSVVENL